MRAITMYQFRLCTMYQCFQQLLPNFFFIVHMCRVICLTLYLLLYMGFYQNVLSFTCVEKSVRHYICYPWGFIKIFILRMCRVICPTLFFCYIWGIIKNFIAHRCRVICPTLYFLLHLGSHIVGSPIVLKGNLPFNFD